MIFIDKPNVSGIEFMIQDWPLQKNTKLAGSLLAKNRVSEGHLDLHRRGVAVRLETPPKES